MHLGKIHTASVQYTNLDYACYQDDNQACNLRIYQVMVESFVDGDPNMVMVLAMVTHTTMVIRKV